MSSDPIIPKPITETKSRIRSQITSTLEQIVQAIVHLIAITCVPDRTVVSTGAVMHAQREGPILRQAKEEIERDFREGIRPIIHRSPDEIAATKRRLDYQEGLPHIAVTGVSGAGKSSLINVLRQLLGGGSDLQKARTGVVETTSVTARYKDDEAQVPIVWYDIPGAGTLNKPDWIYFDEHGLYIFDAIIILIDNRFLQSDVAILKNCAAYNIPTFIVRSKSTLHIRNIVSDLRADSEDTDEEQEGLDEERDAPLVERARTEYIEQTKGSVQRNLQKAGLQGQRVYLIDRSNLTQIARSDRLRSILNGLQVDDEVELKNKLLIHELELISDLFNAVLQRYGDEAPVVPMCSTHCSGVHEETATTSNQQGTVVESAYDPRTSCSSST